MKLHPSMAFVLTCIFTVTLGGGFAFLVFGIIYLIEAMYVV